MIQGAPKTDRPARSKPWRKLRINWILARPSLAGGVKSNRLIAEATARRGHQVLVAYPAGPEPWPTPLHVRAFTKRVFAGLRGAGREEHHLTRSTVDVNPVKKCRICPDDVPDADFCIASWWQVREAIDEWPPSKGMKVHLIRGYEVWGDDPQRVRAVYRLPGLKVVISTWLQQIMVDEFRDLHTVLVPNGVDRQQFDAPPRGRATVPTVGLQYGTSTLRGANTAFASLRLAQQRMPQLRVIAFGRSPILKEHRSPANFEYYLRPDQRLIPKLCRSADCWIVPSTSEGFGLPGLEAAACRCPVVSTRCGGPEDYVDDGVSGRLVDVGDAPQMANAVLEILDLNERQWRAMSDSSYRISLKFDWDQSAEKLEHALLSAADGGYESASAE